MSDIYADLKSSTPEERVATIRWWFANSPAPTPELAEILKALDWATRAASDKCGWEEIAPA